MPVLSTLRTPLRSLDTNIRTRGPELSPFDRGQILGARKAGLLVREIEVELNLLRGAIRHTIESNGLRSNGVSLPRQGCPLVYTERDCRSILRNLRIYLKLTFEQR
ncbi:hypothetical protein OIDMADRAFT_20442 [Oidiodendron maius Zn]|uniref:Uncharacterized protein n=1 Tax=Oidiodendron maius (strain Zn) TaxID=913774 RepID=A0A0C3CDZ8_OIDMZ|nr:hypothetical protein OIDMADRAFT_20442 [Oidiodendron maius Zn]